MKSPPTLYLPPSSTVHLPSIWSPACHWACSVLLSSLGREFSPHLSLTDKLIFFCILWKFPKHAKTPTVSEGVLFHDLIDWHWAINFAIRGDWLVHATQYPLNLVQIEMLCSTSRSLHSLYDTEDLFFLFRVIQIEKRQDPIFVYKRFLQREKWGSSSLSPLSLQDLWKSRIKLGALSSSTELWCSTISPIGECWWGGKKRNHTRHASGAFSHLNFFVCCIFIVLMYNIRPWLLRENSPSLSAAYNKKHTSHKNPYKYNKNNWKSNKNKNNSALLKWQWKQKKRTKTPLGKVKKKDSLKILLTDTKNSSVFTGLLKTNQSLSKPPWGRSSIIMVPTPWRLSSY